MSEALWSAVKKTRLNSSKDSFIAKSSRLSTKKKLSILLNFLFPFVFYRRIFNLEIQNFSLENHHMMNVRQPFCWWMTFTEVSNPLLPPPPHPLCSWPCNFCGGWGYGWFSLGKNFFPKSLELEIFSLSYNSVRFFFSALYTSQAVFFSVQDTIFPSYILASFFPSKSACRIFFLKITHNPRKSQMVGP